MADTPVWLVENEQLKKDNEQLRLSAKALVILIEHALHSLEGVDEESPEVESVTRTLGDAESLLHQMTGVTFEEIEHDDDAQRTAASPAPEQKDGWENGT